MDEDENLHVIKFKKKVLCQVTGNGKDRLLEFTTKSVKVVYKYRRGLHGTLKRCILTKFM